MSKLLLKYRLTLGKIYHLMFFKRIFPSILLTILLTLLTSATAIKDQSEGDEAKIQWLTFEEAVAKAKKDPKKIFIDVYTDWCGWCKRMDASTFSNAQIAAYMNEKFYSVKLNAEQREDINFNGHTFKFVPYGNRGYHELAAALLKNRLSYPTVVFMDEHQNLLTPVPGFQQPKAFDQLVKYFGEDHYQHVSWEEFQRSYQSPF